LFRITFVTLRHLVLFAVLHCNK